MPSVKLQRIGFIKNNEYQILKPNIENKSFLKISTGRGVKSCTQLTHLMEFFLKMFYIHFKL